MAIPGKVVIVGDDFGPMGEAAILAGLEQLASGAARTLHVMHVYDPGEILDQPDKSVLEREEELLADTPAALDRRVQYVASSGGISYDGEKVHSHARLGKPVETLLQTCVDYDADLLVLGTHGRRGLDRMLMGSVAEELVRKARCPVLVARPKDYEDLPRSPRPDAPYAPGQEPRRADAGESLEHVTSTTIANWHPSDSGPTGFRIV